jgi:hypothetical protein
MHWTARSSTICWCGETAIKLPGKQFTVANLMSVVLVTAPGLAGLMNSTPIWASILFTLAVSLLCAAIVGAVFYQVGQSLAALFMALLNGFA